MTKSDSKVRASKAVIQAVDEIFDFVPSFEEVFSEEGFYIIAGLFTLITLLVGVIISRHVTLKDRF